MAYGCAVRIMYKYAEIKTADEYLFIVNFTRVPLKCVKNFSAPYMRVLRGLANYLTDSDLRFMTVRRPFLCFAKEPISGCEMGSFGLRNALNRVLIWWFLQCEMVLFVRLSDFY